MFRSCLIFQMQPHGRLAEGRKVLCGEYSSTFRKVRWRPAQDTEGRGGTARTALQENA